MPAPTYPQFEPNQVQAVQARVQEILAELPRDLVSPARQLFDRLAPGNWPVEWYLPWWLGHDLGLTEGQTDLLTLCNVLGLGYARLVDSIHEEVQPSVTQRRLAAALHYQAIDRLDGLLSGNGEFWRWHDEAMRDWQLALSAGEQAPARRFDEWTEADTLLLAWRGAPVKITAAGACLLARRSDAIPMVLDALDHMLVAQVLLDHLDDWQADLEAGRFNAFVAFVTDLPQSARNRIVLRRSVLDEFLQGDAGAAYVDLARRHIGLARRSASALPCRGLADYLSAFDWETARSHLALQHQVRTWLSDVSAEVFGPQHSPAVAVVS